MAAETADHARGCTRSAWAGMARRLESRNKHLLGSVAADGANRGLGRSEHPRWATGTVDGLGMVLSRACIRTRYGLSESNVQRRKSRRWCTKHIQEYQRN